LAVVVMGGLVTSTLLTLIVLPTIYARAQPVRAAGPVEAMA
jgi:Cu/Ag efflux pump CusA